MESREAGDQIDTEGHNGSGNGGARMRDGHVGSASWRTHDKVMVGASQHGRRKKKEQTGWTYRVSCLCVLLNGNHELAGVVFLLLGGHGGKVVVVDDVVVVVVMGGAQQC